MKEIKKNVVMGHEAITEMVEGLKIAADAIRLSYGPCGLNAAIQHDLRPYKVIANDANTIVQALEVDDPIQNMGLSFAKELMEKSDKDSGDGRKSTLILATEILDQGLKSELKGLELKRELDALIPLIEAKINEQKRIIGVEEVGRVAAIAGESVTLGETLQSIYGKIGKDGIIIPESSGTFSTSFSFVEGVRFTDTGYLSPYMVHDEVANKESRKETKAIYENPTILVTKRKIGHLNDINPLLETLQRKGIKDLVIFTDDMDSGVASIMVKAHQDHVLNILIIKAPVIWKQYVFEDFAKITGSTIIEDATGLNFKNLELKHLGTCGRIEVDKEDTIVTGIADIGEHIAELKAEGSEDSLRRLAWLQTKTAILKLGANNESELSYLRLKCYDAINSSRLALKDGVVEGGGICLLDISYSMPDTIAGNILKKALKAPFIQNVANMGVEKATWGNEIQDAASVVKSAVRNAISLASTILTTGLVITFPPKTPEQIAAEALQNKGFRM